MKNSTLVLIPLLASQALAQVLFVGDSANLLADPTYGTSSAIGSLGWTRDPIKDVAWIQVQGPADYAYVVYDATTRVVERMDDYIVPFHTGLMWQEGSDFPTDVWLRVYLTDDLLASGDVVTNGETRSVRFGFATSNVSPLIPDIPEPVSSLFLAGLSLLAFAGWRKLA